MKKRTSSSLFRETQRRDGIGLEGPEKERGGALKKARPEAVSGCEEKLNVRGGRDAFLRKVSTGHSVFDLSREKGRPGPEGEVIHYENRRTKSYPVAKLLPSTPHRTSTTGDSITREERASRKQRQSTEDLQEILARLLNSRQEDHGKVRRERP